MNNSLNYGKLMNREKSCNALVVADDFNSRNNDRMQMPDQIDYYYPPTRSGKRDVSTLKITKTQLFFHFFLPTTFQVPKLKIFLLHGQQHPFYKITESLHITNKPQNTKLFISDTRKNKKLELMAFVKGVLNSFIL